MTEATIRSALADTSVPVYQREEVVSKIFQHGIKVFGTLVLLSCPNLVSKFIEMGQLEDGKLPFQLNTLITIVELSMEEAESFHEKQWEFIAPAFIRGTLHRKFEEDIILPFVEESNIGGGAFGDIYETILNPDHQELGDMFPQKFARKEFTIRHGSDRSILNHQKELMNLAILNHLKHPNIVELLGSYTWNAKHSLLFPLADTGNLHQFLNAENRSAQFETDETIVIALAALSSAVQHVHDFSERKIDLDLIGCHHDLRPRNILISGATFILADFGLSTFKPRSQNSETPFKNGTDDYLAPECLDLNNGLKKGTVHRSSDIWSLGCIIAEIATYIAFGRQGVKEFLEARKHKAGNWEVYYFHNGPGNPSGSVEEWLSRIESLSSGNTCALLVRLVRNILCIDQAARPRAREVTFRLRLIALYDVATDADLLFRKIRDADNSLDLLIEHTRFMSWRHAIGILDSGEKPGLFANSSDETMSKFDIYLSCLKRLRGDLKAGHARPWKTQYLELSRIVKANDELHNILSQEQKQKYREYLNIYMIGENDELFERIESGNSNVTLNNDIRMRANIKHINTILAKDDGSNSRRMLLELSAVEQQQSFGEYSLGRFHDGGPIWVEWRKYGKHNADEQTLKTLYKRAAGIAELLSQDKPEQFRTLKCTGFFHEPVKAAFGIVFEIPLRVEYDINSLRLVSLDKLIAQTADKYSLWPDLDDRFWLASTLAASILQLHTVGWFHKGLNASNIVFFSKESVGQGRQSVREPFLVGFNHSRPDDPLAFTSGVSDTALRDYQHPTYIEEGQGFQPEFDYYSMGIVLLEIGCWQPLSKLMKRLTGSYEERRRKLLEERVPQLKVLMGRDYYEAVRCCLKSDFGDPGPSERNEGAPKRVLLQFGERVVARLRKNFVQ